MHRFGFGDHYIDRAIVRLLWERFEELRIKGESDGGGLALGQQAIVVAATIAEPMAAAGEGEAGDEDEVDLGDGEFRAALGVGLEQFQSALDQLVRRVDLAMFEVVAAGDAGAGDADTELEELFDQLERGYLAADADVGMHDLGRCEAIQCLEAGEEGGGAGDAVGGGDGVASSACLGAEALLLRGGGVVGGGHVATVPAGDVTANVRPRAARSSMALYIRARTTARRVFHG